ncbi:dinucleotide-utilizing enzyme possibly involved in molybdopterin or thiamin biosynthesis [Synechococcus sp. PCC 7502]|uniref:molybdopterin-synthase adenylyltransferase MoeB n=1 Tax=Synechococcus sp. PCC 7502 TaxID=1173263 RepID=UPI00029FAC4B|nr:molybdopterin-synthase adenylyltransferase MoeB [Synechococcus sp. PCC 7502]AFY72691.1 dinucleotide-utilizing enzyme possibly involved in molybdopterin or thiamin biosynthesis [Synechococcus sp. PCC 7502]
MLDPDLKTIQLNQQEYERYSRHLILPEVGVEGQKKLKAASVLCIGTGGLGAPLLMYLAAAGVGRIGIVDFDIVDASNLQRQVIHGTSWIGKPKIESAKNRIYEINPHCQVDLYETMISSENALEIMAPYDIVVDGTDNFPTRYLVNDACVLLNKPNVYGSIYRFEGQATVFNYKGGWLRPDNWDSLSAPEKKSLRDSDRDWIYDANATAPNYRDLYPEPPPPGLVPSCAEGGVLGILPGIIGVIQATETIKIILGKGTNLSGRLLLFDALKMSFRELKLRPNPVRPVITQLIDYQQFCGIPQAKAMESNDQTQIPEITVTELKDLINNPDYVIIDVRNPSEWEIGRIPNTTLIPLPDIENGNGVEQVRSLVGDRKLVVHCKLGGRSLKALGILKQAGIDGINVKGGIIAWSEEIDSSIPKY